MNALPILLHHPSFLNTGLVCKLLCVSKAVRDVVAEQCPGQVPVERVLFTLQDAQQLAAWIPCNGYIMQSLDLHLGVRNKADEASAGATIAVALQQAAAAHSSLRLQCFKYYPHSSALGTLLQHLPCSHLTKLELNCEPTAISDTLVTKGLAHLRGLRELSLLRNRHLGGLDQGQDGFIEPLMPALSVLTHLTKLKLWSDIHNVAVLQHLPAQLLELACVLARDSSSASGEELKATPINLAHLTALTRLGDNDGDGGIKVCEGDVLPQTLRHLELCSCVSTQPLLALHQLQSLSMSCSRTPADSLQQLSSLQSLTEVALCYYDGEHDMVSSAAAAAWAALPLRELIIASNCATELQASTVQQLGSLTHLTLLSLSGKNPCSATPHQLAAAIKQLTALAELHLSHLWVASAAEQGFQEGVRMLAGAIAGLPNLSWLTLQHASLDRTAAAQLAAATHLVRNVFVKQ